MLRSLFATLLALLFASATAGTANAVSVLRDAEFEEPLRSTDRDRDVAVIIRFSGQPDLRVLNERVPATTRDKLIRDLYQKLVHSEQAVRDFLGRTLAITSLGPRTGIDVTLPPLRMLTQLDGREPVSLDGAPAPFTASPDDGKLLNTAQARDASASTNSYSFPVSVQLSARPLVRVVGARGPPFNANPAVPGMAQAA
jgi:hypothetical protein